MKHVIYLFLWVAALLLPVVHAGDGAAKTFPFVIPVFDASPGVTDMSFLNGKPADQLVTVRDGHFFAGGQRIRFWGMDSDYEANYPTHEEAERLAARFAKLGVNMLRITHTDQQFAPRGLYDPAHPGEMRIDPERMERLDYYIATLKKHGIYVELSIHVSHLRMMGKKGIPELGSKRYSFGTGLPLWNEHFVAAEMEYARDLLQHVNPYTGKPYTQEPAVAFVEIINENGVLCAWSRNHLLETWSAPLVADFQSAWNAWLKQKYGTTDRLRPAWNQGDRTGRRDDLLQNREFSGDAKPWKLQCVAPSTGSLTVSKDGYLGHPCLVVTSDPKDSTTWHVNLQQASFAVTQGGSYELSFYAKADAPMPFSVSVTKSTTPYTDLGLSLSGELTKEWRRFTRLFASRETEKQARLIFRLGQAKNRISFAEISLQETGIAGLEAGQTLETGNVALVPSAGACQARTPQVIQDMVDFLCEIDDRYFTKLFHFLKQDLGCVHPVKGTQANSDYSSPFTQATCDFIDVHGYWQHPANANDRKNWTFHNEPMVNASGSTAVRLAMSRVKGKPFHVSEYGHPAPSTYCSEEIPTIASFGAFQDWDGITLFTYALRTPTETDQLVSFFEHFSHPTKLVTMPFGALAFRRGDVMSARQQVCVGVTLADVNGSIIRNIRREQILSNKGASWLDAFTHGLAVELGSEARSTFQADRPVVSSDTRELTYDASKKDACVLVVNSPLAKAVIGYGAGKTFDLGGLVIQPGPTLQDGFGVITASVVAGEGFQSHGARILLTATGSAENVGMGWNATRTSVGDQWGKGPVQCEGIPFVCTLKAGRVKAWRLDARGQRTKEIPAEVNAGAARFYLGPQHKTLWYEVVVE